jgi:hypothetical protein
VFVRAGLVGCDEKIFSPTVGRTVNRSAGYTAYAVPTGLYLWLYLTCLVYDNKPHIIECIYNLQRLEEMLRGVLTYFSKDAFK